MLDTERNQPIRVCAMALPFSHRIFGISKGMSAKPIPYSMKNCSPLSSAKVERIDGATVLCSQPVGLVVGVQRHLDPLGGRGVVEAMLDVVLARPLHTHRRAHLLRQPGRLVHEVAFRLPPEAAAQERDVDGHVLDRHARIFGDILARAVRTSAPAPRPRACRRRSWRVLQAAPSGYAPYAPGCRSARRFWRPMIGRCRRRPDRGSPCRAAPRSPSSPPCSCRCCRRHAARHPIR